MDLSFSPSAASGHGVLQRIEDRLMSKDHCGRNPAPPPIANPLLMTRGGIDSNKGGKLEVAASGVDQFLGLARGHASESTRFVYS
jgi:hypothetical protein